MKIIDKLNKMSESNNDLERGAANIAAIIIADIIILMVYFILK